jgi:hypothetical protein
MIVSISDVASADRFLKSIASVNTAYGIDSADAGYTVDHARRID